MILKWRKNNYSFNCFKNGKRFYKNRFYNTLDGIGYSVNKQFNSFKYLNYIDKIDFKKKIAILNKLSLLKKNTVFKRRYSIFYKNRNVYTSSKENNKLSKDELDFIKEGFKKQVLQGIKDSPTEEELRLKDMIEEAKEMDRQMSSNKNIIKNDFVIEFDAEVEKALRKPNSKEDPRIYLSNLEGHSRNVVAYTRRMYKYFISRDPRSEMTLDLISKRKEVDKRRIDSGLMSNLKKKSKMTSLLTLVRSENPELVRAHKYDSIMEYRFIKKNKLDKVAKKYFISDGIRKIPKYLY